MNSYRAFQAFLAYLDLKREKVAHRKIEQIAKSEKIDDFLAIENSELGAIEYCTTHGFRSLYPERPELNEFVVAKKGEGFSKARNLPYIYLQALCEPPQLIVESPCAQATNAGYATAVKLPYAIASKIDEYLEGATIVYITEDNKEAASFGYANAVPLPYQKNDIRIHRTGIFDTEYAAMLMDFQRF